MRKRERLLRLRPFNMANFSSGSSFLGMFAFLSMINTLPMILILWAGLAIPMNFEEDKDNSLLKRRVNRIVLPICVVLFVLAVLMLSTDNMYISSMARAMPAIIWISAFPTIGVWGALRLAANTAISKKEWLAISLAYGVALAIGGVIISIILLSRV